MTKQEAFAYLELPETASRTEIKTRIIDKTAYYEDLAANASSDFLRKINRQHVDKVQTVKELFFADLFNETGAEVLFPLDASAEPEADAAFFTMPVIVSKGEKLPEPVKPADPPAWLIRHTEDKVLVQLPVKDGKNYLGRKAQEGYSPFLLIEEDPYVSRLQAVIFNESPGSNQFFVADSPAYNNAVASRNGTYLNGSKARIEDKILLKDGDTLQLGVSKYVFRLHDKPVEQLIQEVANSAYTATVSF